MWPTPQGKIHMQFFGMEFQVAWSFAIISAA